MSSYALVADLSQLSLPAVATKSLLSADIQAALDAASNTADGYMADALTLPILPIPNYTGTGAAYLGDLKQAVCDIAAYRLMKRLGFKATGMNDELRVAYDDAIAWLKGVGSGKINPPGLIDSTGNSQGVSGGPQVSTEALRGFQTDPPNSNYQPDPGTFIDSWD
jgi:phage gp36-like protein